MENDTQLSFDYNTCFKNIYYKLYANSNTSRAERIVSDITKILLCKLIAEQENIQKVNQYSGEQLLEMLRQKYPQSCEQYNDFSLSDNDIQTVLTSLNWESFILFGPASALFQAAPVVIVASRLIFSATCLSIDFKCFKKGNSLHFPLCPFGQ